MSALSMLGVAHAQTTSGAAIPTATMMRSKIGMRYLGWPGRLRTGK